MNLQQKIASKPKLESIDSSIESCIEILRQELVKRDAIVRWSFNSEKVKNLVNEAQYYFEKLKNE